MRFLFCLPFLAFLYAVAASESTKIVGTGDAPLSPDALLSSLNTLRPIALRNHATLSAAAQAHAATMQSLITKRQTHMLAQGRNELGQLLPQRIMAVFPYAKVVDELIIYTAVPSNAAAILDAIKAFPGIIPPYL